MGDPDNNVPSAGAVEEEEDVDEIRLELLIDELSNCVGKYFSREELTQAIIVNKFDVKSALRYLNRRESSVPRQSPEKMSTGSDVDNFVVQYQLPNSYCNNSVIFFENKNFERLPLSKMIRDWLGEILRKRSKQKREEEKARYFRVRNESQCSEDSVATTSGESQDIIGDSSQDLSEDSQDMVVDYFDQDFEKSTDISAVESHSIDDLSANSVSDSYSLSKEDSSRVSDSNIQLSSASLLDSNTQKFPVPKLKIAPLCKPDTKSPGNNLSVTCTGIAPQISSGSVSSAALINSTNKIEGSLCPSLSELSNSTSGTNKCSSSVASSSPGLLDLANSNVKNTESSKVQGISLSELANCSSRNVNNNLTELGNISFNNSETGFRIPGLSKSHLQNKDMETKNNGIGLSLSELAKSNCQSTGDLNFGIEAINSGASSALPLFSKPQKSANSGASSALPLFSKPQKSANSGASSALPLFSKPQNSANSGTSLSCLAKSSVDCKVAPLLVPGNNLHKSKDSKFESSSPSLSSLANSYLSSSPVAIIPPLGTGIQSTIASIPPLNVGMKGSSPSTPFIPPLQSQSTIASIPSLNVGMKGSSSIVPVPPLSVGMQGISSSTPFIPPLHLGNKGSTSITNIPPLSIGKKESNLSNHQIRGSTIISSLANLAVSGTDNLNVSQMDIDMHLKQDVKPPPGFENFVPGHNMPEKECVSELLTHEVEIDINAGFEKQPVHLKPQIRMDLGHGKIGFGTELPEKECLEELLKQEEETERLMRQEEGDTEIDLLSALMKPQSQEEVAVNMNTSADVLMIEPQVSPFRYDPSIRKRTPSAFGQVMVKTSHLPKVKRLMEKVIHVPFRIFRFDTPSPDELIQEALQNRKNPEWYKLITKERLSRRNI